jgi:hypothetical protein
VKPALTTSCRRDVLIFSQSPLRALDQIEVAHGAFHTALFRLPVEISCYMIGDARSVWAARSSCGTPTAAVLFSFV